MNNFARIMLLSIFSLAISTNIGAQTVFNTSSEVISKSDQKKNPETVTATTTETTATTDKTDKTDKIESTTDTASADFPDDDITDDTKDPLERFNRAMFMFNDKLDYYLIKPVAEIYNDIVPRPLNKGIHNFFNNLGEVPTIINDFLQFNFFQGFRDIARFSINSTIGIGGFFDLATRMQLPYFQNDFGLTLARWGYKDSSYLVLPVFGSNTIRDGIFGLPVDYFEFSVYPYIRPQSTRFQLLTLFMVDHRASLLQFEPVLEEAAIDKYVFMRNAYMQHRAFQIEQVQHLSFKEHMQNKDEANGGEKVQESVNKSIT